MLWVWSAEPVHEPLIPKWMYDELAARRAAKRGSRDGNAPNTHPKTQRTYVLRGMVFHSCDRRMYGNHRHGSQYYMCNPASNNRGRPDKHAGHEKAAYIREDEILGAVSAVYVDRVFGPHRRELFAAGLASADDRETRQREAERERLQRTLADLSRRQDNLMRQAQDCAPDDAFGQGLRETYNTLETERREALAAIAELDAAEQAGPLRPSVEDVDLLDALPYLTLNLTHAPEQLLRGLFEITQLTVRLHEDSDDATITIRLPATELPVIAAAAERITNIMDTAQDTPAQTAGVSRADAVRAPGRIRTCDLPLRRRTLYPLSYEGATRQPSGRRERDVTPLRRTPLDDQQPTARTCWPGGQEPGSPGQSHTRRHPPEPSQRRP